jgi:hypothetical protein
VIRGSPLLWLVSGELEDFPVCGRSLLFALVLSLGRYVVDGIVLRAVSEPGQ